jgi:hypothetical protein
MRLGAGKVAATQYITCSAVGRAGGGILKNRNSMPARFIMSPRAIDRPPVGSSQARAGCCW